VRFFLDHDVPVSVAKMHWPLATMRGQRRRHGLMLSLRTTF
jgi:hypothetical protein